MKQNVPSLNIHSLYVHCTRVLFTINFYSNTDWYINFMEMFIKGLCTNDLMKTTDINELD
jgi:hypothetical protein